MKIKMKFLFAVEILKRDKETAEKITEFAYDVR